MAEVTDALFVCNLNSHYWENAKEKIKEIESLKVVSAYVLEAKLVNEVYDAVVRVKADNPEDLRNFLTELRHVEGVASVITLLYKPE